jgi:hypothetical protein
VSLGSVCEPRTLPGRARFPHSEGKGLFIEELVKGWYYKLRTCYVRSCFLLLFIFYLLRLSIDNLRFVIHCITSFSTLFLSLTHTVPSSWNRDSTFQHTLEGDDDMPGHVKASIMGVSLNIPIGNGRLALGAWQGIYLDEHLDQGGWGGGHTRSILITIQGQG